jgi:hypothetical protein
MVEDWISFCYSCHGIMLCSDSSLGSVGWNGEAALWVFSQMLNPELCMPGFPLGQTLKAQL